MEQFPKHQRVEENEYTSKDIYAKQKHAEEKKSEAQLLVCFLWRRRKGERRLRDYQAKRMKNFQIEISFAPK